MRCRYSHMPAILVRTLAAALAGRVAGVSAGSSLREADLVEVGDHSGREEAGELGHGVAFGGSAVLVERGEADVEEILGAGERDVEEAALFFDQFFRAGGHVGGDVAVGRVQDVDARPTRSPWPSGWWRG